MLFTGPPVTSPEVDGSLQNSSQCPIGGKYPDDVDVLNGAHKGEIRVMLKHRFVGTFIGLAAVLMLLVGATTDAVAQSARISISISKAGFVVGMSSGTGTLKYRGKRYPLSVGGVRFGLTVGASTARMHGQVYNLRHVRDIEGTYGAVEASAAAGVGPQNWVLENEHGVRLVLRGRQRGLEASLSSGGISISLR